MWNGKISDGRQFSTNTALMLTIMTVNTTSAKEKVRFWLHLKLLTHLKIRMAWLWVKHNVSKLLVLFVQHSKPQRYSIDHHAGLTSKYSHINGQKQHFFWYCLLTKWHTTSPIDYQHNYWKIWCLLTKKLSWSLSDLTDNFSCSKLCILTLRKESK